MAVRRFSDGRNRNAGGDVWLVHRQGWEDDARNYTDEGTDIEVAEAGRWIFAHLTRRCCLPLRPPVLEGRGDEIFPLALTLETWCWQKCSILTEPETRSSRQRVLGWEKYLRAALSRSVPLRFRV